MVRILIERHLKEGKRGDLMHLLRLLRTAAMCQPGYVTGETLTSTEDPSIISVLSTWHSLEEWEAWEKSRTRINLYNRIESLLVEEPKVSIYRVAATEKK